MRAAEIRIQEVRRISGGSELRANLLGREARLLQLLTDHVAQLRILLQQLSQLVRGHAGWQPTRQLPLCGDLGVGASRNHGAERQGAQRRQSAQFHPFSSFPKGSTGQG